MITVCTTCGNYMVRPGQEAEGARTMVKKTSSQRSKNTIRRHRQQQGHPAVATLAWNKAGLEAREKFLTRIDQPVMDKSYGRNARHTISDSRSAAALYFSGRRRRGTVAMTSEDQTAYGRLSPRASAR
jgi:hypothetical protein